MSATPELGVCRRVRTATDSSLAGRRLKAHADRDVAPLSVGPLKDQVELDLRWRGGKGPRHMKKSFCVQRWSLRVLGVQNRGAREEGGFAGQLREDHAKSHRRVRLLEYGCAQISHDGIISRANAVIDREYGRTQQHERNRRLR